MYEAESAQAKFIALICFEINVTCFEILLSNAVTFILVKCDYPVAINNQSESYDIHMICNLGKWHPLSNKINKLIHIFAFSSKSPMTQMNSTVTKCHCREKGGFRDLKCKTKPNIILFAQCVM